MFLKSVLGVHPRTAHGKPSTSACRCLAQSGTRFDPSPYNVSDILRRVPGDTSWRGWES